MRLGVRSVRMRLALWYAGALGAILLVFAVGVYALLRNGLLAETRRRLAHDLDAVRELVLEDPDELDELEEHSAAVLFCALEDGRVIYASHDWRRLHLDTLWRGPARDGEVTLATPDDRHFRLLVATFADMHHKYRAAVAHNEQAAREALHQLEVTLLIGYPLALALAVLGGYVLAGRMLAPVGAMARKARRITADRLSERLPVEHPGDEFGRLASVFNDTLARLEDAFERLRRFTGDASHELRTPLTALRSVGEIALRDHHDAAGYREAIGSMLEEVDRLTRLVDSLLVLTRADAGRVRLQREPLDVAGLVRDVVEHLHPLAEEKSQRLTVDLPASVEVFADRTTLRQALINLLDNAIKYTPPGGQVRVRVGAHPSGEMAVEVIDTGPGIPPEEHERVFERFYRLDKARARTAVDGTPGDHGGAGLGLAIARWAVEANGGRIELVSETGRGSTLRVVLPAYSNA